METQQWSKTEKAIARRAFEEAYKRECAAITDEVRRMAGNIAEPNDVWRLQEFLTRRRREIDEKYDYRYSVLLFVFARLVGEGWIKEAEIAGLSEDKLDKIRLLAGLANE